MTLLQSWKESILTINKLFIFSLTKTITAIFTSPLFTLNILFFNYVFAKTNTLAYKEKIYPFFNSILLTIITSLFLYNLILSARSSLQNKTLTYYHKHTTSLYYNIILFGFTIISTFILYICDTYTYAFFITISILAPFFIIFMLFTLNLPKNYTYIIPSLKNSIKIILYNLPFFLLTSFLALLLLIPIFFIFQKLSPSLSDYPFFIFLWGVGSPFSIILILITAIYTNFYTARVYNLPH